MQTIWSPWRMNYIMNHERAADCIFCKALCEIDCPENLVVFRGKTAFVILNRYPYTSGHLLIVPFQHVPDLDALSPETRAELMELANHAVKVLGTLYTPQGFNLGINLGEAAGAGIAAHLHLHVVPRWQADANFMTTIGQSRVLPENLEDTYLRILEAWNI